MGQLALASPWLHTLGNSCYLWLSLEFVLPFGKIMLGTPIRESRPQSHHSAKEKNKSTRSQLCWATVPGIIVETQPPSKETPTQDGAFALSPQEPDPLREVPCLGMGSCLLHAAFVNCLRREVSCSFIANIWGCHLLIDSEENG